MKFCMGSNFFHFVENSASPANNKKPIGRWTIKYEIFQKKAGYRTGCQKKE